MDEEDGRAAWWTIFGVLCAFKLTTAVLVFALLPSLRAAVFLAVFNWFWLIPLVALVAGIALSRWRLVRVRARRARLRRAEFTLE